MRSPAFLGRSAPARPNWQDHRPRLDALREARSNLDLTDTRARTEAAGWHIDAHEAELTPEPPGPPLPPDDARASWAVAGDLVRHFAFPDPSLLTGIFSPEEPLPGRPMLLRARFLGLTFWFGARVGREIDEVRDTEVGPVHVYGFDYATLEGHFERGQITFEVRKEERSGRVLFHIDSFSRAGVIRNPVYRVGFKLFGRRLQLRFARTAMERMQRFVKQEVEARSQGAAHEPDVVAPTVPPLRLVEAATDSD